MASVVAMTFGKLAGMGVVGSAFPGGLDVALLGVTGMDFELSVVPNVLDVVRPGAFRFEVDFSTFFDGLEVEVSGGVEIVGFVRPSNTSVWTTILCFAIK